MTRCQIAPHREQDIHTPRAQSRQQAAQAWGERGKGLPRPLWQDVAAGLGLTVIIGVLLALGWVI